MLEKIEASQIADYQDEYVIIDVRSPSEYAQGHIPMAKNIPLFTDEERAIVGTTYKKASQEKAILKGLDFVGRKMTKYISWAKKFSKEKKIIVYCWRGGKRSGSLSWLFDLVGFDVKVVIGGYKSYRNLVLQSFENQQVVLNRIGGKTGTGKTAILHALAARGEQIIDLEALAHHKGSAFGDLGEKPQPTSEQFENELHATFSQLDFSKKIWVENESRGIGKVFIPQKFWDIFSRGNLYNIQIDNDLRVKRLVDDYAKYPLDDLIKAFESIEKKIGGQHKQAAIQALHEGDFATATQIALVWYDKTYGFGLEKQNYSQLFQLTFDHADMEAIVEELLKNSH